MTREVAAKLAQARKLIERGWCQGYVARDANGKPIDSDEFLRGTVPATYCAQGALIQACGGVDQHWDELDTLGQSLGLPSETVGRWNDDPKRKKSEVIEAFRRAEQLAGAE